MNMNSVGMFSGTLKYKALMEKPKKKADLLDYWNLEHEHGQGKMRMNAESNPILSSI
jgi:hypothetical protein